MSNTDGTIEEGYTFKHFFQDGSLLLLSKRGKEIKIDNGDSIIYDL